MDVDVTLDHKQVIIGENNVGKTNFLSAIQLILDKDYSDSDRQLTPEDFHDSIDKPMENGVEVEIKPESKWTSTQHARVEILFERYPSLEQAYKLVMQLGNIYHHVKLKGVAFSKLAAWYDRVEKAGFESFNIVVRSIQSHYLNILNYFETRSTNASAESFNAKIKAFRASFRTVRNVSFFLYRLAKIYA